MDNEDMIRDQMENTRTSLTEKLETLESKVASTVDTATSNVAETVEAVKDTVQETVATMKDSVQETISAVKESVRESVDAVKDAFDVSGHVQRHPWEMLGGSVVLGFVLGNIFAPKHEAATHARQRPASAGTSRHGNTNPGNGKHGRSESPSSASGGLFEKLAPEIDKLKGLAIGTLMGAFRDMIMPSVPPKLGESLSGIIDNITEKLGGTSVKEGTPRETSNHPEPEESEAGDVMGSRWAKTN